MCTPIGGAMVYLQNILYSDCIGQTVIPRDVWYRSKEFKINKRRHFLSVPLCAKRRSAPSGEEVTVRAAHKCNNNRTNRRDARFLDSSAPRQVKKIGFNIQSLFFEINRSKRVIDNLGPGLWLLLWVRLLYGICFLLV